MREAGEKGEERSHPGSEALPSPNSRLSPTPFSRFSGALRKIGWKSLLAHSVVVFFAEVEMETFLPAQCFAKIKEK